MNDLRSLLSYLFYVFVNVCIRIILTLQSLPKAIRVWLHRDQIRLEEPYKQQEILLIALYEKGTLRDDIKQLLLLAKSKGYYVIGVNTLKLLPEEKLSTWFNCYIERFNFGRDFGSYKTGFHYIFKKQYHLQAPRVFMLNDSVYYESKRCSHFLETFMHTPIEVLGATENHERIYHLGSFCISISGKIMQNPKFIKFWSSYINSELRPSVIKHGEMGLSRCLKSCVSSAENFQALYNVANFYKMLETNPELISIALNLVRRSPVPPHWAYPNLKINWLDFIKKNYMQQIEFIPGCTFESNLINDYYSIFDLQNMEEFFRKELKIVDEKLPEKMRTFICASLINTFSKGSQIHQNNILLLHLGLPIIKLDGFYRGIFSTEDVLSICAQIPAMQTQTLLALLFNKSYGPDALGGWQRLLFNRGFL